MQRELQGSHQEGHPRIATALKEVKWGVAEFVRERGKKLHGFFRLCRGKLQGHRQEGNRVSSSYLGISEGVAEFPSGMADKSCSALRRIQNGVARALSGTATESSSLESAEGIAEVQRFRQGGQKRVDVAI
jgi:hypothetical protein